MDSIVELLLAKAEALDKYGNSLPEGVTTEAFAGASLLRSRAGKINELLERQYIQGSTVTNCIQHMGMPITERPDDCKLCLSDLRNHMSRAIAINKWLNEWKDDATKILEER